MVWFRFGSGSFGMACIGAAAILVLMRSGAIGDIAPGALVMTLAIVGVGLGVSAMIRATPAHGPYTSVEAEPDSPIVTQQAPATCARVVPMLPTSSDTGCTSWLGGAPRLPKGAEWPVIAGQPAQFLAQIDCAALPDTLWQGTGPRHGSMAFFRAAAHDAGELPVRVLHVEGPLKSVSAPDHQARRPRWPLLVKTADQDGSCAEGDDYAEPDWSVLHDVDLTHSGYQPFDWTSAAMLLNSIDALIASYAKRLGDAARDDQIMHLRQTSDGLAELRATLVVAQTGQAFDDLALHTLQDGLAALTLPENLRGAGASAKNLLPMSRHRCAAQAFFAPFERHCRQVYAESPCHLPSAQRALFEPFWAHNARHETGRIGTADLPAPISVGEAELLLELPSSELLGWMFGEGRALRIYVTPDDLEQGVLDRAWGSVAA